MIDPTLMGLTHEQQQKAVEQIQQLMAQGIGSGEAIQIVAAALRKIKNEADKQKKSVFL